MEFLGISITEWIGYAASLGVLLSFLMRDIIRLRTVNSIGCFLFVIYGFMLPSIPVIITNLAIFGVNVYFIFFRNRDKKQ
ncbi:uroporphyrinogen decarboxylase [Sinomicrobium weinanense]|uniref:Uroporphyrinogen decarboxylase n=1 Tax=Sinomicrobium weinanense TaxID=2842200 RepID=A0A926Q3N0_9FLAO|nr:uroporphyrinogen decarboxylase [Sinomicrobium weinanense]MBC9796166.1 uroporphyrinogen decarboxylase [Sinomicrobium weinanense]MBU3123445.1 uroporphyrinogen decarboxylase [Sinomicrobium weinanense]